VRIPSATLTVIFLITVLAFAWMSIGLGQRGQLVPQIVLSVTLVLLVLQLIFDISPSWQAFNRLQRLRVKVLPCLCWEAEPTFSAISLCVLVCEYCRRQRIRP
jgi:hypothetical protein